MQPARTSGYGITLTELLTGGVVGIIDYTWPGEDKYRLGPRVRGAGFVPPIPDNWPKEPPAPPVTPGGGIGAGKMDELAEFLTLYYCCFDITCDFTLNGETVPGSIGTNIKSALIVQFESARDNGPGGGDHIGAWLDGGRLQDALNARFVGGGGSSGVPWDDIENIEFKPSAETMSAAASTPPTKKERARELAKKKKPFKIDGPIVFRERREALQGRVKPGDVPKK
jgi:hypothetical protein